MTRGGATLRNTCVIAFVVVLVGFLIVAQPKYPAHVRVASPDGTWSVLVFGSKREDTGIGVCSYDMQVNLIDSEGRVIGSRSVGFAPDLASAEKDFGVVFESNEVVRIGDRKYKKDDLR